MKNQGFDIQLSLVMIVKNEEQFIGNCLKSVQGIVDEIIIVDTGSTDNTKEIVKQFNAYLFEHPWENDFSLARNQSISYAKGKYLLILDADEEIIHVDQQSLHAYLQQDHPNHEICVLPLANMNDQGEIFSTVLAPRIFKNIPELRYHGRVHNQLKYIDHEENKSIALILHQQSFLQIYHYGGAPKIYEQRNKQHRTISLLVQMLEENPADMRSQFFLGRELASNKQYETAIGFLEPIYSILLAQGSVLGIEAILYLLQAYDIKENFQKCIELAEVGLKYYPEHPDVWAYLGKALVVLEQHLLAKIALEKCFLSMCDSNQQPSEMVRSNPKPILTLLLKLCLDFHDQNLCSKVEAFIKSQHN